MTTTLIPREYCWACPGRRPVGSDRCPGCGAPPRLIPDLLAASCAALHVQQNRAHIAGRHLMWAASFRNPALAAIHREIADEQAAEAHAARLESDHLWSAWTGPGADGDPDTASFGAPVPAGTTSPPVPCPGCGAPATRHVDGSVTCHDHGHMTPDEAESARRGGWIADQLATQQMTAHQFVEEMRRWTA